MIYLILIFKYSNNFLLLLLQKSQIESSDKISYCCYSILSNYYNFVVYSLLVAINTYVHIQSTGYTIGFYSLM